MRWAMVIDELAVSPRSPNTPMTCAAAAPTAGRVVNWRSTDLQSIREDENNNNFRCAFNVSRVLRFLLAPSCP